MADRPAGIPCHYVKCVCQCKRCKRVYTDLIDLRMGYKHKVAPAYIRVRFEKHYKQVASSPDFCRLYIVECSDCALMRAGKSMRELWEKTLRRGECDT
jgi:hypothetical protein